MIGFAIGKHDLDVAAPQADEDEASTIPDIPPEVFVAAVRSLPEKLRVVYELPAVTSTYDERDVARSEARLRGIEAVRIATGENGSAVAALVPVHAATRTLWFLVDTGNIRGTLVGRHAVEGDDLPTPEAGALALSVGPRPPERLPVVVDDIHFDGVLGTDYLSRHKIAIDLRRAP